MTEHSISAGTPQRIAWAKAIAPGTISGAMPNRARPSGAKVRKANISRPRPNASHSAWRNSGAIASRRLLPSSCETDAVSAIRVPIGTIIGSHSSAVPTVTEARVWVPWRPAMTLSTKPISPVDTWPSTSGRARVTVASSSWPKRRSGREWEDMDALGSCGRAGGTGTGLRGVAMLTAPRHPRPRRARRPSRRLRQLLHPAAGRVLPPLRTACAQPGAQLRPCRGGGVRVVLAPGRTHLPHPAPAAGTGPAGPGLPGRQARAVRGADAPVRGAVRADLLRRPRRDPLRRRRQRRRGGEGADGRPGRGAGDHGRGSRARARKARGG